MIAAGESLSAAAQITLIGSALDRVLQNETPSPWLLPAFLGIIVLRAGTAEEASACNMGGVGSCG